MKRTLPKLLKQSLVLLLLLALACTLRELPEEQTAASAAPEDCLHIMVRYELEKRFINGEISVDEIPALWNEKYKEYLGIEVPDDTHGVLQDSHWSGGGFGYFPSYALGSAYGAQMLAKMKETVDVDAAVRAGNLSPINDWLRERIWRHGKMYDPGELFERCCGAPRR